MIFSSLFTGDSVATLQQGYLVGESTVLPLVRDTCKALYAVLHEKYMKVCIAKKNKISTQLDVEK